MAEQQRAFKGVWIPAEIWLNKSLSLQEKAVLAEIDSFCSRYESCYASNEHFAKFIQVGERRIQKILKSLESKELIEREIIYKKGTKEIEKRFLRVREGWRTKVHEGNEQKFVGGGVQKFAENNTVTFMSNTVVSSTVTDRRTDELQPLIDFYEANIEFLTPFKLQDLQGMVEDFGSEWVQKAMEKVAGCEQSKRNNKYLRGVLVGWKKDNVPKPWEKKKKPNSGADASLYVNG